MEVGNKLTNWDVKCVDEVKFSEQEICNLYECNIARCSILLATQSNAICESTDN